MNGADEELAHQVLQALEELQEGRALLLETIASLEASITEIQDEELRGDLERAWWALEALEERIRTQVEEDERTSLEATPTENDRVDRAARQLREVLAAAGVQRVPLWELYRCRVCGADQGTFLPWGPRGRVPSLLLCSCCGNEFGTDDTTAARARANREEWLSTGARWWDKSSEPETWDASTQLAALPPTWR